MEHPSAPDVLDVSQFSFEGSFDDQVKEILHTVRLSRSEVEGLQNLVIDLENALRKKFRGCKVHPFGSIITGLGIRTSDVDCFVELSEHFERYTNHVNIAKHALRSFPFKFTELFSIPRANVPILKFYHIPTSCYCDANFKSPSGVRNSHLISYLMNIDIRILHLTILVKYWSKVYQFTGTNLLANYALTIMVIFYFQQKNMLPTIAELQKNTPLYMIDKWNTSFNRNYYHSSSNSETLYDLLGGFFKFYSTFDFDQNIISVYSGYAIKRKVFENLENVPEEYDLYKYNVSNEYCMPIKLKTKVCIQDPFDHSRNCTTAIFPKLLERIIRHFKYAAKMYEEKNSRDFLKAVFTEDSESIPDRPTLVAKRKKKVKKNNPQSEKIPNKPDNNITIINQFNKRRRQE